MKTVIFHTENAEFKFTKKEVKERLMCKHSEYAPGEVRLRCILDFNPFLCLILITMTSLVRSIPQKLTPSARSKFRSKLRLSLNNLENIPFPGLAGSCT